MRRPATSSLVTMSLAVTAVVFVAGSAAASPPKKTATTKTTTTTSKTRTPTTTTSSDSSANAPGVHYSVINGTANAASDHEILGSSAFPNYRTGAVDNYYSMAHAHVDNSPFAEGTASPADTGPVGQTAAAGNFQQPQYADARWPGDAKSGKATYGSQGQPYAVAAASEYNATAESSEASNGLSGPSAPGAPTTLAAPKGLDGRLRQALAEWKAKWLDRLSPTKPTVPVPTPTGKVPLPVPTPTGKVTTPTATVPTPITTVTTPTAPVGGLHTTPPVTTVPLPPVPRTAARDTTTPSRSLASASASGSASGDGESLLESSTSSTLDPKTDALVTSGESRLGRVSLGGGQIVIEGIHVAATITNDGKGTPAYKVAVSVAAASIGGVPVTIDQDGVHLAGQGQGVPYKQASDALNGALKQAGIQLFLVGPEIATNSCNQPGTGTGTGTTTTTSSDQSGTTTSSNSCAPPTGVTTPTSSCDQTGTGTGPTTTTSSTPSVTTPTPPPTTTTKTTTTNKQTSTTSTTSSCGQTGMTGSSSCTTRTTPTTTSSNNQTGTTTATNGTTTSTTSSNYQTATAGGTTSTGEMTITATGLHVVFTQPAGAPAGVPAQNAEHILGEVFLDSLAVPGVPFSSVSLNLNFNSSSSTSSCLGGVAGGTKSGGVAAGGLSAGGSNSSSSLSPSGYASTSQPGSSATGSPLGTSLAHLASWARRKPKWLLLSYLVWQALALAAAASLWKWQGEGAS